MTRYSVDVALADPGQGHVVLVHVHDMHAKSIMTNPILDSGRGSTYRPSLVTLEGGLLTASAASF